MQHALYMHNQMKDEEVDKRRRDHFIGVGDNIMHNLTQFGRRIQKLLPYIMDNDIVEPTQTLKDLLIKERIEMEANCSQCGKSFINESRLARHYNNKHKWKFPCSVCKICFENEMVAWVHEQIIHTKIYSSSHCQFCQKLFSDSKGLRRHILKLHSRNIQSDYESQFGRKPLGCEILPERTQDEIFLEQILEQKKKELIQQNEIKKGYRPLHQNKKPSNDQKKNFSILELNHEAIKKNIKKQNQKFDSKIIVFNSKEKCTDDQEQSMYISGSDSYSPHGNNKQSYAPVPTLPYSLIGKFGQ